jgi:beta-glucosidase
LFGEGEQGPCEPGGRLPVTFPRSLEDTPAFEHHPGRKGQAKYLERRLIGYRWYDTVGREPLFAFGHGLSYASMTIESATLIDSFTIEIGVANSSERDGSEVVQVYASRRTEAAGREVDEPVQRLVGFARLDVSAGGRARALIDLDPRSYSGWDVAAHAWMPIAGAWELRVGRSSRAIVHTLEVASSPR